MAKKQSKEEKELQDQLDSVSNFTSNLPKNVFEVVPDEELVSIEISGSFHRAMIKAFEYVMSKEDEKEAIRAAEFVKLNYDKERCDLSKITFFDTAVWVLSQLIAEFNIQATIQKKTKAYDKTALTKAMLDKHSTQDLTPLTTDEIDKRAEMERLAKEKKDKEESNED